MALAWSRVTGDGHIFQTDVHGMTPPTHPPLPEKISRWRRLAAVVLVGIRLGLDNVIPIY
jgi:hypothetical protein